MKTFLLPLLIILVCFSACTRNFVPAMYLHDEAYMHKPFLASSDSATKHLQSVHISGKLHTSINSVIGVSTRTTSGMLQLHQGHSFRYFTLAYGLQGTVGGLSIPAPSSINPQYAPQDSGRKFFQALGARLELGVKAPLNSAFFEWRMLNLSLNYSHEMGEYLRFRQRLTQMSNLNYSRGSDMLSWSVFTEFGWRLGRTKPDALFDINFKAGFLRTNFQDMVYEPQATELQKNTLKKQNDILIAVCFRMKHWQITYQTTCAWEIPIPIFAGISHGLQVGFNISDALKKGK